MFEKFTERARKVMSLSRQHAQRLNNDFIGTEHILLGLLEEDGGIAAKTLKLLGVDKQAMIKAIETKLKPSDEPTRTMGQLPWSPRAKKALQITEEEAFRVGAGVIGTEHLLLGLFMEGEGIAFQAMSDFKITEQDLRAKIEEVLRPEKELVATPKRTVTMDVHLFKGVEKQAIETQTLFFNKTKMEVESIVRVDGIPTEKMEAIAAALAKEMGAIAYMIDPIASTKADCK